MCLAGYIYFIDVYLIYNAMSISAIQQSDYMYVCVYTHTHTHMYSLSSSFP